MPLELRLLLACARIHIGPEDETSIRKMLTEGVNWTLFVQKAIDHGLAGMAGNTLAHVAPDMVPDDILDAFHTYLEWARSRNLELFDELARLTKALSKNGVEAIAFKGPVIAIQAYGDLGLRLFRDLDFLIRDSNIDSTIATLHDLGYRRRGQLTEAQFELTHRLQGQEVLFNETAGIAIEPHTRLIPMKMALAIDYEGIWRRAQMTTLNGHTMMTLEPEDHFLVLAIHGGKEFWWRINWACDVAALAGSYPNLDWIVIMERARAQGCLRMVLLAASLARKHFDAAIPDVVTAAEQADPLIEPLVQRVMTRWLADRPVGPPSNKLVSMDRFRLYDGAVQRAAYVARTWFLPGPAHVAWIALPRGLRFAYIPLKIAHDVVMLPLWRAYCAALRPHAKRSGPDIEEEA